MSNRVDAQMAYHHEIDNSPEHNVHTVLGCRVDTWKDEETGVFVALIHESMTQGQTEAEAVESAKAIMLVEAQWGLEAAKSAATTGKGEQG